MSQVTFQILHKKNISQIFSIIQQLIRIKIRNFKCIDKLLYFHGVLPFDFYKI